MIFLVPFITGFFLSFFAIKFAAPYAAKVGLVDLPNARKLHDGAVPLIGGVGIFFSVMMASTLFIEYSRILNLYIISSALILFIGVLDDRYDLSVRLRIIAQVIIASILIFGAESYLTSLGNIFYFVEIKLGYLGVLVTVLAVIGSINAFNMVDGIDGLAGMLSIVTFTSLAFLFYQVGNPWFILPILFIAAIMAYLCFNLRWPFASVQKVFMGDAGSMLIGLTVVWLLVTGTESINKAFSPVIALYLIAIPLMDMTAIMYRRLKKGHSPFKPDRDHLHHIFERAGYSRKQTLARITLLSAILAMIGILGELLAVPEAIMFVGFLVIFAAYNWALAHVWQILTWIRRNG
ncbi:UDP-N-acetylglucosamine--undecaprenyl-phosphate N-acetylglucosaminephosphotransferase [Shewanella schlegeliana]|uniref:Undecaprenyl-phosphate alpha-N-acetylglucosaminyl 1-phosphate transferase n=1 Tax=Shewanella schlegeliana TaxID=190308 RepID=A0ABS1SWE5_9GAMM|nr:UDP-N-acetylglucosamine--undecaprenyl-phosphate N-acetylglucosaminephosphotransferase [Shewanella schlegeliana]MBL4911631.1 UDP-N-acetylglucosamine--undecaprenyl-phosphate N-acetylglucosaminephosphotransferase [Shewanella schlegeliana]MCL1111685.1 UDP-N-acetylglucosamine--undecaprenyl-phosphate N-acetylglucosaminephosphotransferase [Shewanella schlegeliana]GIU36874.1 undecaprenyl-phosphate alpha-N-acetylglucosaminyl 1-phosphate transferase [Shewanella schlegeliana]